MKFCFGLDFVLLFSLRRILIYLSPLYFLSPLQGIPGVPGKRGKLGRPVKFFFVYYGVFVYSNDERSGEGGCLNKRGLDLGMVLHLRSDEGRSNINCVGVR